MKMNNIEVIVVWKENTLIKNGLDRIIFHIANKNPGYLREYRKDLHEDYIIFPIETPLEEIRSSLNEFRLLKEII